MQTRSASKASANSTRQEPQPSELQRFLRLPDVLALTGLSVSTLYEMMRDLTFPRPLNVSKRLVVWLERDVAAWQAAKIAANNEAVGRRR